MISGQVDRLRTAAQTYRRLGNHSAESMLLDAADTICELQTENAKLRKLVDGLTWCCEHYGCRQECPLYDVSEPDHCLEVSIKRELGVEVDG